MPNAPKPTKLATLRALLAREAGATLPQLCAATGWQPHSTRAAFSGLRKTGGTISRTAGPEGSDAVYRLIPLPPSGADRNAG